MFRALPARFDFGDWCWGTAGGGEFLSAFGPPPYTKADENGRKDTKIHEKDTPVNSCRNRSNLHKLLNLLRRFWRRGPGSNRRIKVLQTSPLPLGYRASGCPRHRSPIVPSLISPASTAKAHCGMERETRLELATLALARRCSTTELLPLDANSSISGGRRRVKPAEVREKTTLRAKKGCGMGGNFDASWALRDMRESSLRAFSKPEEQRIFSPAQNR